MSAINDVNVAKHPMLYPTSSLPLLEGMEEECRTETANTGQHQ